MRSEGDHIPVNHLAAERQGALSWSVDCPIGGELEINPSVSRSILACRGKILLLNFVVEKWNRFGPEVSFQSWRYRLKNNDDKCD